MHGGKATLSVRSPDASTYLTLKTYLLLLLLMLFEAISTALTMDTTSDRNPIELIDCAGRHCLPPSSGMKISGAFFALK